jgi:hypothetical protein
MYLSSMNCAIYETNPGDALQLPPPPPTIPSAQSDTLADASANRNWLNVFDLADKFKIH